MDIALSRVSMVIYMVLLRAQKNLHIVRVGASDSGLTLLGEVLTLIDLYTLIPIAIGCDFGWAGI